MSKFNEFFINYGEFHDNIVNKLIHIVCIPMITFSLFGLLQKIPGVDIVLLALTSLLYLRVDKVCGGITIIWSTICLVWVRYLFNQARAYGQEKDLYTFFIIQHLVSWIAQFIGHGIFEKRAPALLSNILLILNAPFFVTAEILEFAGWRKEEFRKIHSEINARVKAFKEKNQKVK